jgi:hypothetical protein
MRVRGFSSWVRTGLPSAARSLSVLGSAEASSVVVGLVTVIWLPPREVLWRRRAVRAAVSFSKVMVASLWSPEVVMSKEAILPLWGRKRVSLWPAGMAWRDSGYLTRS